MEASKLLPWSFFIRNSNMFHLLDTKLVHQALGLEGDDKKKQFYILRRSADEYFNFTRAMVWYG